MVIKRYKLRVTLNGDSGFVDAKITLYGETSSKEVDYHSVQTVLNGEGGRLFLRTNGQTEVITVFRNDSTYNVLVKIQSDILEAITKYFSLAYEV